MPPRARPAFSFHPSDLAFGTALMFLIGIFCAGIGWPRAAVLETALAAGSLVVVFRPGLWREFGLLFAVLLAGILYYHVFYAIRTTSNNLPVGREASFSAIVSDEPTPTQFGSIMLMAKAQPPLNGGVTIFVPESTETADISYGDLLNVTGTITAPKLATEYPQVSRPQIAPIGAHRGFFLREWMIRFKNAALKRFRGMLGSDEAALLGGIAFGSRASFTPELKNAMALSGTTHLVAVSGYNITVVIIAAGALFGGFLGRRATFFAAVALLVLFMFMVGAQASAVRAAVMGFIGLVAREMGEAASMRNLLALTAAVMAAFDPSALTADLGFILSFASLLGIVYLGPSVKRFLGGSSDPGHNWNPALFGLRESAATTISAQLAVMPILIRSFGQFSLTAVFANMFILGTVPLAMLFGGVLAGLAFVSGLVAFFVAELASLIINYELFVIRFFASFTVPLGLSFASDISIAFYYSLLGVLIFSSRLAAAQPR